MSRRTLTKDEFEQLGRILSMLEPGYAAVFRVSPWAPDGFHIIPGDGRVCCTPETMDRLKATADLIGEAKAPTRRAVMADLTRGRLARIVHA